MSVSVRSWLSFLLLSIAAPSNAVEVIALGRGYWNVCNDDGFGYNININGMGWRWFPDGSCTGPFFSAHYPYIETG